MCVSVTVISAEFVWKGIFSKEEDWLNVGRRLGRVKSVCRCRTLDRRKCTSQLVDACQSNQKLQLRCRVSLYTRPLTSNVITYSTCVRFSGRYQVNVGQLVPTSSTREPLGISGKDLLPFICPSCHPTNSAEALTPNRCSGIVSTFFCFNGRFPGEPRSAGLSFFFHLFHERTFGDTSLGFFTLQMPYLSLSQHSQSTQENSRH